MQILDRFLPGFNHILCGNPPKSPLAQLEKKAASFKDASLSELADLLGDLFPASLLAAKKDGTHSRNRTYSLNVTFWAFLSQILSPKMPCLEAVRKVQSHCCKNKLPVSQLRNDVLLRG